MKKIKTEGKNETKIKQRQNRSESEFLATPGRDTD